MKQCYFCQQEVKIPSAKDPHSLTCLSCYSPTVGVYMAFAKEELIYAHLHVPKYHIILFFQGAPATFVFHKQENGREIYTMTLKGFPLTPANIQTKLPLYLLLL